MEGIEAEMSPFTTFLLGSLVVLWLGPFQSFVLSPFAPLETHASDGALSFNAQIPIYKPRKESIDAQMPIYKPRKESTIHARIGGPSRGQDAAAPSLIALVPDHIAFTIKNDTSLCWYLSVQTSRPVTVTVADSQRILPILETSLSPPIRAGIHCVHLQRLWSDPQGAGTVSMVCHPRVGSGQAVSRCGGRVA